MGSRIDVDEPPIFDVDEQHEVDPEPSRGGELVLEGVRVPPDVVAFGNGRLPPSALQEIGVYKHRLHPSAAAAFLELRAAAAGAGIDLTCTDSYRSIEQQVDLKNRKPSLSATPGKSVHGWGFAVDLSIDLPPRAFGQSVYQWLQDNAPELGWFLGRPRDEPWHWVYRGPTGALPANTAAAPASAPAAGGRPAGWALDAPVVAGLLGLSPGVDAGELAAAVVAFQRAHGLADDGVVGPRTSAALVAQSAPPPTDRPELQQGSAGESVRWVQLRVGCVPDGRFGPVTERAVRAFQAAAGLAVDGRVGPKTWAALVG
jgi:peptidoglycan hydrolase-like protein with peptidoglycan-binding domain